MIVLLVLVGAGMIALRSVSGVWTSDEPTGQQDRAEFERAFQDAAKAPATKAAGSDDAGAFRHDGGP